MLNALLPIIVGFVLTGLIGNRLLRAWQARDWLLQQRFLGKEKEFVALRDLTDEIGSLLGVRLFHMRRLARTLANGMGAGHEARFAEHDEALKRWNERLSSFYVRLPMLAEYSFAYRLENSIQTRLVATGAKIEQLAALLRSGKTTPRGLPSEIERELNELQGRAIAFNKRLLALLKERRVDVYYGKEITFAPENLKYFSTWQLIKALFVRDVNSLSVVRASLDL